MQSTARMPSAPGPETPSPQTPAVAKARTAQVKVKLPRNTQAGDRLIFQTQAGPFVCSVPGPCVHDSAITVTVPLPDSFGSTALMVSVVLTERLGKLLPRAQPPSLGEELTETTGRVLRGIASLGSTNSYEVMGKPTVLAEPYDGAVAQADESKLVDPMRHPYVTGVSMTTSV